MNLALVAVTAVSGYVPFRRCSPAAVTVTVTRPKGQSSA
jgi:hypothetical protein